MIGDPWHTIITAQPLPNTRLALTFADGHQATVDLTEWSRHKALRALSDPEVFRMAHIDARGSYVSWIDDELELAADNLRNLATEQAGGIGYERLWNWQHRNNLTQQRAADAIGISRRMFGYYLAGAKPIPLTVWLACLGWESQSAA
ncbi:MAG: hypothetical protein AABY68_05745 [Pseudomonadota bacterium]